MWLAIPLRQRESYFLNYFIVLAISDPIGYLLNYLFQTPFLLIYFVATCCSFIFLFNTETLRKNFLYLILAIVTVFGVSYLFMNDGAIEYIFFITHILILIRLNYLLILNVARTQAISLFYVMLVFYETLVLSKFINNFTNFADAVYYFIVSTGIQIALGLFFLIFKEKDHRIVFQLN